MLRITLALVTALVASLSLAAPFANAQAIKSGGATGTIVTANVAVAAGSTTGFSITLPTGTTQFITTQACVGRADADCALFAGGVELMFKASAPDVRSTKCVDFIPGAAVGTSFSCASALGGSTNCDCLVTGVAVKR